MHAIMRIREIYVELFSLSARFKFVLAARFLSTAATLAIMPYLFLFLVEQEKIGRFEAAIIVGAVSLGGRLFSYPIGKLVDKYKYRLTLLFTNSLFLASVLILALIPSAPASVLGLSFLLQSFAFAAINVGYRTAVAEMTKKDALTISFSWLSLSFNLGSMAGAAASAFFISTHSFRELFLASALFSSLALLTVYLFVDQVIVEGAANRGNRSAGEPQRYHTLLFPTFCFIVAATAALLQQVQLGLAFYFDRYVGNASLTSLFFGTQAALLIFFLPFSGRWMRNMEIRALYIAYVMGTAIIVLGYVAFSSVPRESGFIAAGILAVCTFAAQMLAMPSVDALAVRLSGPSNLGQSLGAVTNANAIGSGIGVVFGAYLLNRLSTDQLPYFWYSAAFVFGAVFAGAAILGYVLVSGAGTRKNSDVNQPS